MFIEVSICNVVRVDWSYYWNKQNLPVFSRNTFGVLMWHSCNPLFTLVSFQLELKNRLNNLQVKASNLETIIQYKLYLTLFFFLIFNHPEMKYSLYMCSHCWFYHLSRFKNRIEEEFLSFSPWISSFSSYFMLQHAAVIHYKISFYGHRNIYSIYCPCTAALTLAILLQLFFLDTYTGGDAGLAAYCSLYCCSHCKSLWIS